VRAKTVGRRTVVRMIVRLRLPESWFVDAIVTLLGILGVVVVGIVGHSERAVVTIREDDEVVELVFAAEDAVRLE